MGALILLLLVTTRKLHQDAVAKAKAEKSAIEARRSAEEESAKNQVPLPLPDDHPAFQTDAAKFVIAVASPAKQLLPPTAPPDRTFEKEALRKEWEAKLSLLRKKWDSLQQRLREGQRLLSEREITDAALEAELARLQGILDKLQAEQHGTEGETEKVKTTQKTVAQQIAELQAELTRLKSEKAEQADKFQLVPYLGGSPTHSRPIIVECDRSRITFASEQVSLTAADVSGFNSNYNPLRAGTDALIRYWREQPGQQSTPGSPSAKPYLLFVIRPGGTTTYYVARQMLLKLDCQSGYELIPNSTELVWPQTTPEATKLCRDAVDEVLDARQRLLAQAGPGAASIPDDMQFEGQNGEFTLREVEQMKNPQQSGFMGGQRVVRVDRPQARGVPGYAAPQAPDRQGFVGPKLEDLKDEFGRSLATPAQEQASRGTARPHSMAPRAPGQSHGPKSVGEFLNQREEDAQPLIVQGSQGGKSPVPAQAQEPLGNVSDPGRGEGDEFGDANSAQANPNQFREFLNQSRSPETHHPPTNELDRVEQEESRARAELAKNSEQTPQTAMVENPLRDSRAHPLGDRTEVHEATDDPTKSGDWNAQGVAGGKGTFQGHGTSDQPAPGHIPVQSGVSSDPIAKHLPRPLPEPPPRSLPAKRFVVVTVDAQQVKFGNQSVAIETEEDGLRLGTDFSQALEKHVSHWGRPPKGFYWQPAIQFRILPGGNLYYAWLHSATQQWGMSSTVEYVFD